jgi:hypothetical protein
MSDEEVIDQARAEPVRTEELRDFSGSEAHDLVWLTYWRSAVGGRGSRTATDGVCQLQQLPYSRRELRLSHASEARGKELIRKLSEQEIRPALRIFFAKPVHE